MWYSPESADDLLVHCSSRRKESQASTSSLNPTCIANSESSVLFSRRLLTFDFFATLSITPTPHYEPHFFVSSPRTTSRRSHLARILPSTRKIPQRSSSLTSIPHLFPSYSRNRVARQSRPFLLYRGSYSQEIFQGSSRQSSNFESDNFGRTSQIATEEARRSEE